MALTLRPTPDEENLIEDIKLITDEKSSSKAILKGCAALKVTLCELEKTKSQLFEQRQRANKSERILSNMQRSIKDVMNYDD